MKRRLRLHREALCELTTTELADVRGGAYTVGDHCGPPFDTTWLPPVHIPTTRCTPPPQAG